jgi:hypothetical protein
MQSNHRWITAHEAWKHFTLVHPELAYRNGAQQFYNFLRYHKDALVSRDALRRAKGRFWIAHIDRFTEAAFELATGGQP